jgi:hypothetical protein
VLTEQSFPSTKNHLEKEKGPDVGWRPGLNTARELDQQFIGSADGSVEAGTHVQVRQQQRHRGVIDEVE